MPGIIKKLVKIIIAIMAVGLVGSAIYLAIILMFPPKYEPPVLNRKATLAEDMYRMTGKRAAGPFTGQVVDADTGEPIKGAQVRMKVNFMGFMDEQAGERCRYTETGEDGWYDLAPFARAGIVTASSYIFVVYKAGYEAHFNGLSFSDDRKIGAKFKPRDNLVMLRKWDESKLTEKDRVSHVVTIGCKSMIEGCRHRSDDHIKFCREAREEMIYRCMYHDHKYPKSKQLCENSIDKKLELY